MQGSLEPPIGSRRKLVQLVQHGCRGSVCGRLGHGTRRRSPVVGLWPRTDPDRRARLAVRRSTRRIVECKPGHCCEMDEFKKRAEHGARGICTPHGQAARTCSRGGPARQSSHTDPTQRRLPVLALLSALSTHQPHHMSSTPWTTMHLSCLANLNYSMRLNLCVGLVYLYSWTDRATSLLC